MSIRLQGYQSKNYTLKFVTWTRGDARFKRKTRGKTKGSPKKDKTNKNCGHWGKVVGCTVSTYGWAATPLG